MDKIIKQTKFFCVSYKPDDKSIDKLFKPIKKAESKYYKIFKIKPKQYSILVVYSRKEFNKFSGFRTPNWVNGHFKNPYLIVFSPSVRNKYVKRNKCYDYDSFFDHEINHLFYLSIVGNYNPVWLAEGYACYMMKTFKPYISKKYFEGIKNPEKFLFYRYIKKKYYKHTREFYSLSFYVVKYLIENFGHKKIVTLIKRFAKDPYQKILEKEFKKIYSMSVKEAVRVAV